MTLTLTAYCVCVICCDKTDGLTADSTIPRPGITIAAPRRVPFGTIVTLHVEGIGIIRRRVEDRTHRRIDGWDLLVGSHREAQKFGRRKIRRIE